MTTIHPLPMPDGTFRADLHLHTTASDGAQSPKEVVHGAKQAGMNLIAITDHDTLYGLPEALAAGKAAGLGILPGIELSCGQGEEVHILGYGVRAEDPVLTGFLQQQLAGRQARMLEMLDRLSDLGVHIEPDETRSGDTPFMGRMNLAYAMVEHGYVSSADEAFDRYLSPGRPGYVPRKRVSVAEGAATLAGTKAIVVLAHPARSGLDVQTLPALLPEWTEAGLAGIEAYHLSHNAKTAAAYDRLARRYGLLVTGGSDSHGREDGAKVGAHLPMWRSVREDTEALIARLPSS